MRRDPGFNQKSDGITFKVFDDHRLPGIKGKAHGKNGP